MAFVVKHGGTVLDHPLTKLPGEGDGWEKGEIRIFFLLKTKCLNLWGIVDRRS